MKNKKIIVGIVIFISLLVGGVALLNKPSDKMVVDKNIITGDMKKEDLDQKLKDAQEKVKEGMLAIDIATAPTFNDGNSKGKVMIGNPSNNTKNFVVEFVTVDGNELIYKSGLIPPNSYIEEVKLDKNLPKGQYPTIAYFTSYDDEGNESGKVGLNITVNILN